MGLNLKIRTIRQDRGLTLKQLAARIGVSVPHLSGVERGVKNLNNHLIERIARELGVEPPELVGKPSSPSEDLTRLNETIVQLSPEDRSRVEAFALALLRSQQEPPRTE